MDEQDQRIGELERRLEDLETRGTAMERAMERSRAASRAMVPDEVRRHLKAAGREQLLAVRSLLDFWINRMGDQDEPAESTRENIPVD